MKLNSTFPKINVPLLICVLLFNLQLNYCIGQPNKDIKKNEIVRKYSNWYLKSNNQNYLLSKIFTVYVGKDSSKLHSIIDETKASLLRINKLGYADLELNDSIMHDSSGVFLNNLRSKNYVELNAYGEYLFIPNDNEFSSQSYLQRIKMEQTWNIVTGSNCITVAIIDSGLDWRHEDLGVGLDNYRNIWVNQGEDNWGENPNNGDGIDNDGNGFIDDFIGWNFDTNNNVSLPVERSHGSEVGGIVSAKSNNSIGIAGVSGGNSAQGTLLMPIGVGDSAPNGSVVDDAIIYAVDNGANVIQLSLSVPQNNSIDAALNYARQNNVTVVCGTGNFNSDVSYPATNINVIGVGSVNSSNQKSFFSNFGPEVDISAPGEDIRSTSNDNTYSTITGTSFAAPIVSGVISLLLSIDPTLTPVELEQIIENTAKDICDSGFDNDTGNGLIDAYSAVKSILPTVTGPRILCDNNQVNYSISNNLSGVLSYDWNISNNLTIISGQGSSSLKVQASNNGYGEAWIQLNLITDCGNVSIERFYVWVGEPIDVTIQPANNTICKGDIVQFFAVDNTTYPDGVPSPFYEWSFPGGDPTVHYQSPNGNVIEVSYCDLGGETIRVKALNFCGSSAYATHNFNVNLCGGSNNPCSGSGGSGGDPGDPGGGGGPGDPGGGGCGGFICMNSLNGSVSAYPVPTADELNLEIIFSERQMEIFNRANIYPYDFEISIRNIVNHNRDRIEGKIHESKSSFNLSELSPGVYMITLSGHGKTFRRTILIK